MRQTRFATAAAALLLGLPAAPAGEPAAPTAGKSPSPTAEEPGAPTAGKPPSGEPATREELKVLAEELRRLKLEIGVPDVEYQSWSGMGPAASKVYFAPRGLSIGGYGEVVYSRFLDDRRDQSDLLRVVLYAGYRFTPRLVFNAEIELEHGGEEVGVEFAYLDVTLSEALRVRAGNLLLPVGFLNEMHEPAFFHGVFRPLLERNLIPTTWHENGLGLYGELGGLRYKAYLVTGLDAFGSDPLAAGSWLRRARTGGAESPSGSFAGVLSLAWDLGPAAFGAAVYRGRAGQGSRDATGKIQADVTLAEAHASLAYRRVELRGLYVLGALGDAGRVSAKLGLAGTSVLGSRVRGGYLEAAYDLLGALLPGTEQAALPFLRLETMDLHWRVPAGGTRDPALDTTTWTAGVTYKPVPTVVAKADYQRTASRAPGAPAAEQVNLGLGFVF